MRRIAYTLFADLSVQLSRENNKVVAMIEGYSFYDVESAPEYSEYLSSQFDYVMKRIKGNLIIDEPNFKLSKMFRPDRSSYDEDSEMYVVVDETHPLFNLSLILEDYGRFGKPLDELAEPLFARLPKTIYTTDLYV